MSRTRDFRIASPEDRRAVLTWIAGLHLDRFRQGLDVRVQVHEERHSDAQRRLLNVILDDIAEQVEWGGGKLNADAWRALIVAEVTGGRVVPGISGGMVLIGGSSKHLTVQRMSDVIEYSYGFGAERGVKFRTPKGGPI